MINFIKKHYAIVFFAVFSLIPVFWTSFDRFIAGGDDIIFLNPGSYFEFSAWNNAGYFDGFNNYLPRIFPFGFFWWFFKNLGLGNPAIEKSWLWSMWFIGCVSIYYLSKVFFPKNYRVIGAFSAIFYFLNPFTVFIPLTIAIIYTHTFLPLALAFFIRGVQSVSDRERFFYAALFGFATLLAAPVFASPPNALVFLLLPIFYLLFSLYEEGNKNLKNKLIFFVESFGAFGLFNLYHIWSTLYALFLRGTEGVVASLGEKIFETTSLFDVFRTLGGWAFAGNPLNTYEKMFYDNPMVVFFSYFLVLVAIFSIFYLKKNRNVLFLFSMVVVFMFLIKGTLAPVGDLFKYLFENFDFFKAFREPWTKFSPPFVLVLSILFGYSVYRIMSYCKESKNISGAVFFLVVIFAALFSVGYPSIGGKNNWDFNLPGAKSTKVKMPAYWTDMAKWFEKNDPDSPVLIEPKDLSARDYEWESGISSQAPLGVLLFKNPIRYPNYLIRFGVPDFDNLFTYFNSLHNMESDNFYNFLSLLGVKYIVQENDVFWKIKDFGFYSPEVMKEVLESKDFLEKTKTFGKVDVYRVKENVQKPLAYASKKVILSDGPAYAFSSWNKRELDNFSLIQEKDRGFRLDGFEVAEQIFLDKKDSLDEGTERTFNLKAKKGGDYDIVIKASDKGKLDELYFSYKINDEEWREKNIEINRNPFIKKHLDELGYVQVFSDLELGNVKINEGLNVLKIKSGVFGDKNFGEMAYVVLNKHFDQNEKDRRIPEIKTNKISDDKYILNVKNGDENPYILNFNLNFDEDWRLYLLGEGKTALDAPHVKISGGAGNGWYMDPKNIKNQGKYKVAIEYKPQKYFFFFSFISLASILAGIFIILKIKLRTNE